MGDGPSAVYNHAWTSVPLEHERAAAGDVVVLHRVFDRPYVVGPFGRMLNAQDVASVSACLRTMLH